jgi:hypothetical protein
MAAGVVETVMNMGDVIGLMGIEKRRALVANETMEFRKRAMSARLLIDELDLINSLIIQANIPESDWERLKETAVFVSWKTVLRLRLSPLNELCRSRPSVVICVAALLGHI